MPRTQIYLAIEDFSALQIYTFKRNTKKYEHLLSFIEIIKATMQTYLLEEIPRNLDLDAT
jgi:hypothetical protein